MTELDSLFVYGTLLDPAQLTVVLAGCSRWRDLGPAAIAGILYDAGDYPALCLDAESPRRVPGHLIELGDPAAALSRLDEYEGVADGLYVRQQCRAELPDGSGRDCWVYAYARPVEGLPRIARWPPR